MAFDAFYLSAVLDEIRQKATDARVEKIHQPSRDTVIMLLRCASGRERLLFAANPAAPRLHFTAEAPENPAEPPMFCMLLRKHLSGGRLVEIRQLPMERTAVFIFDCVDEMGDRVRKSLVAELMGRTCNLYLLSPQGQILDCLRRVGLDESVRPALPGLVYQAPAPVRKLDPSTLDATGFSEILTAPGADVLASRLMDTLGGLSPLVCREATLFAAGDTDARVEGLPAGETGEKLFLFFREHLTHPRPYFYAAPQGELKQFAFCPIREYGPVSGEKESFSDLLDQFYRSRGRQDAMRQRGQAIRKLVQNLCQRLDRKIAIQQKELTAARDRERLRQLGDIVTANLHRITKGQPLLEAEDFYDEDMQIVSIPLSPSLSPQQNAAKFYKDYARMKNAEKELTHQLELARQELAYLRSVLEELNRASGEQELEEIRQELQSGGYLKADTGKKRMKAARSTPMRFVSTDGFPIYVGRNNRQNDELTFRLARKDDIWLHAQKVHGSHVIISCGGAEPPDDTVTQAAQLAAYYAETAGGQNIPVDVTQVRQVKKLPGAKPGMVIYHTYRSVIVNPYADITVDSLNAQACPEENQ